MNKIEKMEYKDLNEIMYKYVLDNGLTVFMSPKKDYHKYFVSAMVNYGGGTNEFIPNGEKEFIKQPSGVAHFLEHKMFSMPEEIDASEHLSQLGVSSNAFTSKDRTAYYINGSSNFQDALAYFIKTLETPYFTEENIEKEKGIIIQELMMKKDQFDVFAYYELLKNVFKHPNMNSDVLGSEADIQSINKEMLDLAYRNFYHPLNMVITIVGNFDMEEAIKIIESGQTYLFDQTYRKVVMKYDEPEHVIHHKKTIKMDLELPRVVVGVKIPKIYFEKNEKWLFERTLNCVMNLLFGSLSVNYQEMIDKELILGQYNFAIDTNKEGGIIIIECVTLKPQEFVDYVTNIIVNAKLEKFDEEALNSNEHQIMGSLIKSWDYFDSMAIDFSTQYFNNCNVFECYKKIPDIKVDEVLKYFKKEAISSCILSPKKKISKKEHK